MKISHVSEILRGFSSNLVISEEIQIDVKVIDKAVMTYIRYDLPRASDYVLLHDTCGLTRIFGIHNCQQNTLLQTVLQNSRYTPK